MQRKKLMNNRSEQQHIIEYHKHQVQSTEMNNFTILY